MLVRNLTERRGAGKPQSHWEHVINVLADRIGHQSLVQRVKPESGGGRTRVLHRNLQLPCNALELDASNLGFGTRPRRPTVEKQPLSVSGNELQSSGDEENDFGSLDFVEEMPTEVRASSFCLQNNTCLQIQSRTKRLQRAPVGKVQLANEGRAGKNETEKSEDGAIAEQDVRTRPQRYRRPPQILTYNSLENPQYQCVEPVVSSSFVNSIQAPVKAPICPLFPPLLFYNLSTTRGHERKFI